jgi:hypothetical protein
LSRRKLRSALRIPGGTPAFDHLAVAPPLHVPGRIARDRDHALDAVRVREARGEPAADTEPPDGEHFLEVATEDYPAEIG